LTDWVASFALGRCKFIFTSMDLVHRALFYHTLGKKQAEQA
jgi:hypothetical protein